MAFRMIALPFCITIRREMIRCTMTRMRPAGKFSSGGISSARFHFFDDFILVLALMNYDCGARKPAKLAGTPNLEFSNFATAVVSLQGELASFTMSLKGRDERCSNDGTDQ